MPGPRVIPAMLLALAAIACQAEEQRELPVKRDDKALYDSDDPTIIKKSRGNICYDSSDGRFESIVHYTAYANLKDCLSSGGRLPH